MRNQFLLGAAIVALAIPAAASAQETTATIRGTVTNAGQPVAGASVVVTDVAQGTRREVTSGDDGSFNITGLRPGGPYTVVVTSSAGTKTVTDINTVVQQAFDLPVELGATENADTGAVGNEVVVTASSIIGAGSTGSGPRTVLTQRDIQQVASVNRDIRDLERRDPLATLDLSNSRAVSFAGVNPRFNRFTINGVQIGDNFGLNSDANPTGRGPVPFDAIGQFSVSIAPTDIRQGNFQGGAIDTVLLSGTNEFHGTGFYSQSRDELQGKKIGSNVFNAGNYNSETYGATLSGPLIADKLFFMVSAERNTDPRPQAVTSISQVPTLTAGTVAQVQNIAQSVYNYTAGGLTTLNDQKDEKIVGRIDWNVTSGQRLSLSYVNAYESSTIGSGASVTSTTTTGPGLSLSSNSYQRSVLLRAGIAQLNSTWTDQLSTEARFVYKSNQVSQRPLNGLGFAQFIICTDPTNVTTGTSANGNNGTTSCGNTPRVAIGPDNSRQANELYFDTWGGSFQARYTPTGHDIKILAEYNRNRTTNLFLQNAAGAYYFDSLQDFQNRNAATFAYANAVTLNTADSAANFVYEQWTFGIQDTWRPFDNFDVTAGIRYDLYGQRSPVPGNDSFLARYGFTNTNNYKGLDNFQPRLSFNWRPIDGLRIRGTAAVFGGGSPDIYLSNSYSNTGITTNSLSISRATAAANGGATLTCAAPFNTAVGTPSPAAVCTAGLNGVTGTTIPAIVGQYLQTNVAGLRTAPTSSLAPNFRPPSVAKFNLAADYTFRGVDFGLSYLYTDTIRGVSFTDLRSTRSGTFLPDGRPRYTFVRTPGVAGQTADTAGDYQLYNDDRGYSHILVASINKRFDFGLSAGGSYARQWVYDVSPATSSTPGSLYANAAKLDPNFPNYGRSNDETTWAFKYNLGFDHAFFGDYRTIVQLFGETRSGRRFSYTMADAAPPNLNGVGTVNCARTCTFGTIGNNNAFLLYVPTGAADPKVVYDSVATQTGLENLISKTNLAKYRGQIAPENIARNRAFTRIDLHLEQEFPTFLGGSRIAVFADIENLPNLLNSKWGGLRQAGFPYTQSPVAVQCLITPAAATNGVENAAPAPANFSTSSATACSQYRYTSYRDPQTGTVSTANSLYLIRVGARFRF